MKTRIHHLHRLRNDSLTGPGCAILPPELMRYKSVDLPVPSTEIKLLRGIYQVPREQHTSPRSSLQVHSWTFSKLQFPIATHIIKAFGFLRPKSHREQQTPRLGKSIMAPVRSVGLRSLQTYTPCLTTAMMRPSLGKYKLGR